MAEVISLPVRHASAHHRLMRRPPGLLGAFRRVRWLASWDVDDWGRDETLARAAAVLSSLRWTSSVGGLELLPTEGPGVVVVSGRRFMLTTWFVALTLSEAMNRPVRFVGRPDTAPAGALARRLGGVLDRPDEVAGALRNGELLVVGMSGTIDPRKIGRVDPRLLGPAVLQKAPVFPVAVTTPHSAREARIEIGPAVGPPRHRGPPAEVELAGLIEKRIELLLASFGDTRTGTPLDWIPFTSWGRGV